MKRIILLFCFHCILSGVGFGMAKAYQATYNTMNREQLVLANVSLHSENAQIRILRQEYQLPLEWFAQDSPLYYAAYLAANADCRVWLYGNVCLKQMVQFIEYS